MGKDTVILNSKFTDDFKTIIKMPSKKRKGLVRSLALYKCNLDYENRISIGLIVKLFYLIQKLLDEFEWQIVLKIIDEGDRP